jgi:hypothetical protein
MIWQYFDALRRLVNDLGTEQDEGVVKQNVALAILLSITVVEAFLNIYFRVIVSESGFSSHRQRVLDDLERRKSLDYKVKNWPKAILGKSLNIETSISKAFVRLKDRRNALMHFTSTHESLELPGVKIHGLADTTPFDSLQASDAAEALAVAEGMICEFFRLRGVPEQQLKHVLHSWTGKLPV